MKKIYFALLCTILAGCAEHVNLKRTHVQPYEQQIGYTQVVQHGDYIYLSGVAVSGPDMGQAVNTAYSMIKRLLEEHGSNMESIIKETVFTTDMNALKAQINTRKNFFPTGVFPASSWVEVKGLFLPELILEVEVVAIISKP